MYSFSLSQDSNLIVTTLLLISYVPVDTDSAPYAFSYLTVPPFSNTKVVFSPPVVSPSHVPTKSLSFFVSVDVVLLSVFSEVILFSLFP